MSLTQSALWLAEERRVPDPVEDAEREAHFETWKRKGAKK